MLIRRATTVLIFVCATRVWGQGTGAEITGAVTDSTGGFIPNATITIINSQTNAQRTLTTNSSGFYDDPALLPGAYSFKVAISGFRAENCRATPISR